MAGVELRHASIVAQGGSLFDGSHGPIVVGRHDAVVQARVGQGGVDELVAQDGLHGQDGRPGVEQ